MKIGHTGQDWSGGYKQAWGNGLDFDQVFPDGDLGEVHDRGCFQFFKDVVFMGFNGLRAYEKEVCDLFDTFSFGQQLEHFPFTLAQTIKRIGFSGPGFKIQRPFHDRFKGYQEPKNS